MLASTYGLDAVAAYQLAIKNNKSDIYSFENVAYYFRILLL